MNRTQLTMASMMLVAAGLVPATAYHIDGDTVDPATGLTSADWQITGGSLIVCESNGPNSSRNPGAVAPGTGGLCTTGENDATGVAEPGNSAPANNDEYIELDACNKVTTQRNAVGGDCATVSGGNNTIAFHAEIGVYGCDVAANEALYYERLYAWWSYDDRDLSGGNGDPHYNASDIAGDPENTSNVTDDPAFNNEDAWHGHVAVFIEDPTAPSNGSVETKTATITDLAGLASLRPCGASPVNMDEGSGGYGPVLVGSEL